MRWFVLFPQKRCRPCGHVVSEQATACGNMGEDRKNHIAQHKDQQLTRMKIF